QQEAWAIFGPYTGYDWMPGDEEIVIWGKGKLNRVNVTTKASQIIPFQIDDTRKVAETVKFKQEVYTSEMEVKVLRQLITSPDGSYTIFNALGHLWKAPMGKGRSERLTSDTAFEFEPSFSPDGKSIVYVTWDDEKMGAIQVMDLTTGTTKKLTQKEGIFRTPSFSPDGQHIVFRKEAGNIHQGYTFDKQPGIYMMEVENGEIELVSKSGEYPVFSADGSKVFYQTGGYLFGALSKALKYMDLQSKKEHTIFTSKYANRFVPSPDNQWIAFIELHKVYIAPLSMHGKAMSLSSSTKEVPVAQVARDAGINLHWSADSKSLHWTLGNEYYTDKLTERFAFLDGAGEKLPPMDTTGLKIDLTVSMDKPEGVIAFTHARIITMEGDEVIEDGTIVIEDNEIKDLGTFDNIKIPKSA
ncbi:MAG: amidohydrolase, partial [Bacteroidota bacterium]